MKPSLTFTGWDAGDGAEIIRDALDRFKGMVDELEASGEFDFTVVQTHNTLGASDWANELHAFPPGFEKLAEGLDKLRFRIPGRIYASVVRCLS